MSLKSLLNFNKLLRLIQVGNNNTKNNTLGASEISLMAHSRILKIRECAIREISLAPNVLFFVLLLPT